MTKTKKSSSRDRSQDKGSRKGTSKPLHPGHANLHIPMLHSHSNPMLETISKLPRVFSPVGQRVDPKKFLFRNWYDRIFNMGTSSCGTCTASSGVENKEITTDGKNQSKRELKSENAMGDPRLQRQMSNKTVKRASTHRSTFMKHIKTSQDD